MTVKQELYDLAERAIQIAKSSGADDCRVGVGGARFVQIAYRDRKPETIKEATTKGLRVEIFVNKRYSSQITSDLRPESLKAFIGNAVASTRLLAEDPFRTLPDPKYYQGRAAVDLKQYDPDYEKVSPESRHSFVKAIEESCLAKGGDKVISVTASGYDNHYEQVLMTSNGIDGYQEGTIFYGTATMTAKDEGERRPMEYGMAVTMSRHALPKPEDIGAEAAARTLSLLGAKKIKTETLPIIIENRVVADFGDGLIQAMFGRNIQQKQSFLADKKGQKVAGPVMTLIDDPLIPGALGSGLFDSEGMAVKKRVMIDAGVLKEFYVDWYYSRKLGWDPTTGSPTNSIVPPGKRSVKEIMKDLGRGIFITGFIGGNSNPTTGDTSIGIVGQFFDKGEIIHPVSEMNIADNHLKIWQRLSEAANDPNPYGPQRVPSLVFTDVVVSGI
jgi:PmbA protein